MDVYRTLRAVKHRMDDAKIFYEICGDIRRDVTPQRIDMVVNNVNYDYVMAAIDDMLPQYSVKRKGLLYTKVRDVPIRALSSTISSWGAAIFYMTGDKIFNKKIDEVVKCMGYDLDHISLRNSSGEVIADMHEQAIFHRLGLPYVRPEYRNGKSGVALINTKLEQIKNRIPKIDGKLVESSCAI